ncbi:hypothetical protein CDAR_258661 [Caerostris darwini]|uniref:Uncharacterized protein n=1 Tax=Caerostris darwini TaxID=1538125 RepID=A0AAV4NLE0_9ARAC|nr:hypothetical protein CDAR_258661 [Caerostris darwini]
MSCFPPVAKQEWPQMFFRQRILLKKGKEGVIRLCKRRAISSLDHRNQDESTRDNRRIPNDICLPSSTSRDLFPSNDQMSPTHGFSLSINKQQKRCF